MADINNRQQLAEVEYLIQKYYNEHIAGLIGKGYREFLAEHEAQTAARGRSKDGFDVMPSDTVKKEVHVPSTDDILNFVRLKCGTNQRIQKDIYTLTQAWEAAAVRSLGREKYESLSKDGNLAESYVKNRLETLMLEQFARSRMPKSSLEYPPLTSILMPWPTISTSPVLPRRLPLVSPLLPLMPSVLAAMAVLLPPSASPV